jgi:hypothetical protein
MMSERDLDLLHTFWSREKQFAEMAVREMLAQIVDVGAEMNEVVRQLRVLEKSPVSLNDRLLGFESGDEAEGATHPTTGHSQLSLLDTLEQSLT